MSAGPSILKVIDDLFPLFAGPSWHAWRVALAALFGLPIGAEDLALYRRCTGRETPPARPQSEGWFIVGRRGGKSLVMALVAVYLTCFRKYRLAPGEQGVFMIIAADRRQSRVVKRYVSGLLRAVPILEALVANETRDAIELTNGLTIEIHSASFRAVRGYTVVGAVCDELAYWPNEEAVDSDEEILGALRPAMATVDNALLLLISSPYARRGELWAAFEEYFGADDPDVLCWKSDTRTMNPTVRESVITRAYRKDEARAAAEYGAEFRRDVETFLPRELVDLAVVPGRQAEASAATLVELESTYVAFYDPAGGAGKDSAVGAIAHRTPAGRLVVDVIREHRPPFNPETAIDEFAADCRAFGVSTVTGDRWGGEWPRLAFQKRGITYALSAKTKSELYLAAVPLFSAGRAELPDHERLIVQLLRLERRTARGGRDSVDHPPKSHDDVANAAVGALVLASEGGGRVELWGGCDGDTFRTVA